MLTTQKVADAHRQKEMEERAARRRHVQGSPGEVLVPIVAAVAVGERRLIQITGYRPASYGPAPEAGMYLGPAGYVTDPEQATDFRALGPSDEQVAAAVAAYLQANPLPAVAPGVASKNAQMGRRMMAMSVPDDLSEGNRLEAQESSAAQVGDKPKGKRPRRSSSRMSSLAARVLRDPKATAREKKLAASVLSQDEVKGQSDE